MNRPKLNELDLKTTIEDLLSGKPDVYITMSVDQWDTYLETAYFKCDAILIELDASEQPVAAYRFIPSKKSKKEGSSND